MDYTIDTIRPFICFESVAGSHAHGLARPGSDEDLKGVYLAPLQDILTGTAPRVVSDGKQDRQYTEMGEFCRQLMLNNSGALELLGCLGQEQQLYAAPWFTDFFRRHNFLSRKCLHTFTGNAEAQLKRVLSTHAKAVSPPDESLGLADFCRVAQGAGSLPLPAWLAARGLGMNQVCAAPVADCPQLFALFRRDTAAGLLGRTGAAVATPQLDGTEPFLAHMQVLAEAYSRHCRAVAQYRQWQQERNGKRLQTELDAERGGAYDCKHMGHVIRLLHMAREIAESGEIRVKRTEDAAHLRAIRAGAVPLDDLLAEARACMDALPALYAASPLPETPCPGDWEQDLARIRIKLHTMISHE